MALFEQTRSASWIIFINAMCQLNSFRITPDNFCANEKDRLPFPRGRASKTLPVLNSIYKYKAGREQWDLMRIRNYLFKKTQKELSLN